jgi:hypothetical protein
MDRTQLFGVELGSLGHGVGTGAALTAAPAFHGQDRVVGETARFAVAFHGIEHLGSDDDGLLHQFFLVLGSDRFDDPGDGDPKA